MENINNPAQVRASVEEEKRDFEQVVYRVMVSLDFRPETPRVADTETNFSCLCREVPWTRLVTPPGSSPARNKQGLAWNKGGERKVCLGRSASLTGAIQEIACHTAQAVFTMSM
jgi:hypothetical protein